MAISTFKVFLMHKTAEAAAYTKLSCGKLSQKETAKQKGRRERVKTAQKRKRHKRSKGTAKWREK